MHAYELRFRPFGRRNVLPVRCEFRLRPPAQAPKRAARELRMLVAPLGHRNALSMPCPPVIVSNFYSPQKIRQLMCSFEITTFWFHPDFLNCQIGSRRATGLGLTICVSRAHVFPFVNRFSVQQRCNKIQNRTIIIRLFPLSLKFA